MNQSEVVFIIKNITKGESAVIKSEGDCKIRYSPCSSFKIALALMGFDSEILKNENYPEWPYNEQYECFLESWRNAQNPTTWMKNSCVWYSQVLTTQLGLKKFDEYVKKFNYGNQDISGDKGKGNTPNNGLTNSWLSSSLEISAEEQVEFLERLLTNKLPVSEYAPSLTRKILYLEDLTCGWKFFGKTGSGFLLSSNRTEKLDLKHGWFVGWMEAASNTTNDNDKVIVVCHITDSKKEEEHAGPRARRQAREKLLQLIKETAA